jgi:hypothetical protein
VWAPSSTGALNSASASLSLSLSASASLSLSGFTGLGLLTSLDRHEDEESDEAEDSELLEQHVDHRPHKLRHMVLDVVRQILKRDCDQHDDDEDDYNGVAGPVGLGKRLERLLALPLVLLPQLVLRLSDVLEMHLLRLVRVLFRKPLLVLQSILGRQSKRQAIFLDHLP